MSDIVERLRRAEADCSNDPSLYLEAADEIERLRAPIDADELYWAMAAYRQCARLNNHEGPDERAMRAALEVAARARGDPTPRIDVIAKEEDR